MVSDNNPNEKKTNQSLDQTINKLMAKKSEDFLPKDRSLYWWFLLMPGKMLLWLGYMFPGSLVSSIASARRKDVPIVQVLTSIVVYLFLLAVVVLMLTAAFRGR